jgi:hypothetical protein
MTASAGGQVVTSNPLIVSLLGQRRIGAVPESTGQYMEYSGVLDYNRLRFLLQQKAAPLDTEKEATGQTHGGIWLHKPNHLGGHDSLNA